VKAIDYVNYVVINTPTKALKDITLEEACIKVKLDVSHFPLFSIEAWTHILDEKRKVIQPKSEKCIFFLMNM
jgi:hypothetical protein